MMFQSTISPEDIGKLSLAAFSGDIQVIDQLDERFGEAIRYLRAQKIIGFDTETRPVFSPGQSPHGTALLQLSSQSRAFLFQLKKIGLPRRLAAILANPRILKIGAATRDDILGLQKIAGFQPQGFVDLQRICTDYGIQDKSVKKLAAIILGVKISKTQQLSNWEADPLSASQQLYAATDAWVCREMYLRLRESTSDHA